jgi:hypothetical protein
MARRFGTLSLAILALTAACGGRGHAVSTSEQAIAAAQAALIGSPRAAGPFKVVRKPGAWEVSASSGGETATVYVSAKNGRTIVYTDEVREVQVVRTASPQKR